jgi:hypothetical protein
MRPDRAGEAGHCDLYRNSGTGVLRGIWDWGVCSVICNVRAAFGSAGCGPKCEFSRRREEMEHLADQGSQGNPVFGPYAMPASWRRSKLRIVESAAGRLQKARVTQFQNGSGYSTDSEGSGDSMTQTGPTAEASRRPYLSVPATATRLPSERRETMSSQRSSAK